MEKKEGSLTKLENSLNKSNPKMQLILESSKIKHNSNPIKLPVLLLFFYKFN